MFGTRSLSLILFFNSSYFCHISMQISDGISYTMGMLNPNLNNLVHQGKFKVHCIFELKKYTLKPVPGKRIDLHYLKLFC